MILLALRETAYPAPGQRAKGNARARKVDNAFQARAGRYRHLGARWERGVMADVELVPCFVACRRAESRGKDRRTYQAGRGSGR